MRKFITLLTLIGSSLCCISQENVLLIYRTITSQPKEKIANTVQQSALRELQSLRKDTASVEFPKILTVVKYLVNQADGQRERTAALNILLDFSNGNPRMHGSQVIPFLKVVSREVYDSSSVGCIAKYLSTPSNPSIPEALKIAGYVGGEELHRFLEQNDSIYTKAKQTRWPYALAMARLGDPNWLGYCMEKAKRLEVNSGTIYLVYPDLAYTRQKDAVDFLVSVLLNNSYTCDSPNPESTEKVDCGYRIMEILAPVVTDFPFKVGASGDLMTSDYKKALAETRAWFRQKDGRYTINTNTY